MEIHPHRHHNEDTPDPSEKPRGVLSAGFEGLIKGLGRGLLVGATVGLFLGIGIAVFSGGGFAALFAGGEATAAILASTMKFAGMTALFDGVSNFYHNAANAHKSAKKERMSHSKPVTLTRAPVYPQVAFTPGLAVSKQQSAEPASTKWQDMVAASRTNQMRQV